MFGDHGATRCQAGGLDFIAQDHARETVGGGEVMVRKVGEGGSLVDPRPRVLDV